MLNVMIDMETMSSRNNAAIASLGAVAFDPELQGAPHAGDLQPANIFSAHLDLRQQEGRHFDGDTIYWWLQQSQEARVALRPRFNVPPEAPAEVLRQFTKWYSMVGSGRSWSFGATFDLVLLVDLYRWVGQKCPISYRDQYCARTVIGLSGVSRPEVPGLVSHGAVDDAIVQTIWLQQALQKLRGSNA
jgi:hypothetical protein